MLTSRSIPADISVFLRIRCSISPDLEGRSFLCDACDHVFFTPLLTNDQMASLYAGYRGALYNQMRLAVEPGYAPFIPAFADPDSAHDQARRAMYDQTFPADLKSRTHVIDFGGGDGRFSRYIFPNSKLIVVEEDFERNGGDLVGALSSSDMFFCAHVAEHLPRPYDTFKPLIDGLVAGAAVWLEVPQEYPDTNVATFERLEAGSSEISALRIMHEHIAHFSPRSLSRLAKRLGLEVLNVAHFNMINAVVARKPAA